MGAFYVFEVMLIVCFNFK